LKRCHEEIVKEFILTQAARSAFIFLETNHEKFVLNTRSCRFLHTWV